VVSFRQECLGIGSVDRVHADPHARRNVQVPVVDPMRHGNRGEQIVRAECRILGTRHFSQQNHEFIAPLATHGVRSAHTRHQSTRD